MAMMNSNIVILSLYANTFYKGYIILTSLYSFNVILKYFLLNVAYNLPSSAFAFFLILAPHSTPMKFQTKLHKFLIPRENSIRLKPGNANFHSELSVMKRLLRKRYNMSLEIQKANFEF